MNYESDVIDIDDGSCCASCGQFTDEPGYPRQCAECDELDGIDYEGGDE